MSDRLEQLLSDADRATAPAAIPANLAERAIQIARRRQRRRIAAPVLLLTLIVAGACLWPAHQNPSSIALNQAEAARLREQVKMLQAQADEHMQLALQIEKQSQSPSPAMIRTIVNSRILQLEIDQAAFGLLYEADRIAKDPALRDTAAEFYRQIATELPTGAATPIARQRLAEIQRKES